MTVANPTTFFAVTFFLILQYHQLSSSIIFDATNCVPDDDFCDCGDDEIHSSACSMYSSKDFTCEDTRYVTQTLPLSRIGDRICDCCDGSDEQAGLCQNTCESFVASFKAMKAAEEKNKAAGLKRKEDIVKAASVQYEAVRKRLKNREVMMSETVQLIDEYKSKLKQEELIEERELLEMILAAQQRFADGFYLSNKPDVILDRKSLISAIGSMALLGGESLVEIIIDHARNKYELPGPFPDDTEALYLCMQNMITTPTIATEVLEDGTITTPLMNQNVPKMITALALERLTEKTLKEIFPHAVTYVLDKGLLTMSFEFAGLPESLIPNNIPESPDSIKKRGHKRLAAENIRVKLKEMEGDLTLIQKEIEKNENILKAYFGENNMFYAYYHKCFDYRDNEYKYSICPYGEAKQDQTLLGKYDGLTTTNLGELAMKFSQGDRCLTLPTRPQRELLFIMKCSEDQRVIEVSEPSVCSYAAIFYSPLAC